MTDKRKILIVDDEQDLCEILQFNLTAAGYEAGVAYSAEEAQEKIGDRKSFDLLLLDVMMPGMSGFELAKQLKSEPSTARVPIIFLTALDSEDKTVEGLTLGADDYIAKPFSIREVKARIEAVLRRSAAMPTDEIRYAGLTVDNIAKRVWIDGTETELTPTEFGLLWLLLSHRGQVWSRQQLMERIWADVVVTSRTADVNIARLRKKLGRYGSCIVSRTGYGYIFEESL